MSLGKYAYNQGISGSRKCWWVNDMNDEIGQSRWLIVILTYQKIPIWLVVSTPLKNISQIGNLPQIGVKIKNI